MRPHGWVAFVVFALLATGGCSGGWGVADPSTPSPAPTSAPADANLVDVGSRPHGPDDETAVGAPTPLPRTAFLQVRDWRTTVTEVAVGRKLPTGVTATLHGFGQTWDREHYRKPAPTLVAAAGHEFVVAYLASGGVVTTPDSHPLLDDFEVVAGGRTTAIDLKPNDNAGAIVVVSVPIGADAVLQYTDDDGHVVRLSLRTGTVPGGTTCRAPTHGSGSAFVNFEDPHLRGSETVVRLDQVAFVDGRGFARQGRCWLTIDLRTLYRIDEHGGNDTTPPEYSGAQSVVTALTIDGTRYPADQSVLDVPEAARSVRLTVRPRDPRKNEKAVRWQNTDTWRFAEPATLTIPLTPA